MRYGTTYIQYRKLASFADIGLLHAVGFYIKYIQRKTDVTFEGGAGCLRCSDEPEVSYVPTSFLRILRVVENKDYVFARKCIYIITK